MRRGIRISAAAVAISLLAGCGGTTVHGAVPPPPPEAAVPHRPARSATPSATPSEERVYLQGPPPIAYRTQEGAATLHIRRFSWQRTANGQQAAPPQHRYVVLDVQITATEGRVHVNPLYFVARTPGQTYAPTLGADGNEPVLASTELGANQTVEGIVTFDAPAAHLTVQINDELGRNVGEVVVPAPPGPVDPLNAPTPSPEDPAGLPSAPGLPGEPVEGSGDAAGVPGSRPEATDTPAVVPDAPVDTTDQPAGAPDQPAAPPEDPAALPEGQVRGD